MEETGLRMPCDEVIDMTELALESVETNTHMRKSMYLSPGGSDEFMPILVWVKRMSRPDIMRLKGRLTGLREEGEMITLKLVRYEDLWREGARDAKTLAAWALYEGLKREGKLL